MADSMGKSKMQSQTVEKIVELPHWQVQTLERVVPVTMAQEVVRLVPVANVQTLEKVRESWRRRR